MVEMEEALQKLTKMEACTFDIHLSDALERKCSVGENTHLPGPTRRRKSPSLNPARAELQPMWQAAYSKNARVCCSKDCPKRTKGILSLIHI